MQREKKITLHYRPDVDEMNAAVTELWCRTVPAYIASCVCVALVCPAFVAGMLWGPLWWATIPVFVLGCWLFVRPWYQQGKQVSDHIAKVKQNTARLLQDRAERHDDAA